MPLSPLSSAIPLLMPLALVESAAASPIAGPDLWRYLLVSGAMVGLIVAIGWVLRRFVAANLRARASTRSLRVIDVLPLGNRKSLAVVRVYDRTLVVGLGEKEVNLVTELESEPEPAAIVPARKTSSAAGRTGVLGAFERLRARVGEALPRPVGGTVAPKSEPASAPRSAARSAPSSPSAPVAPTATARGRLGNGRGLLG